MDLFNKPRLSTNYDVLDRTLHFVFIAEYKDFKNEFLNIS